MLWLGAEAAAVPHATLALLHQAISARRRESEGGSWILFLLPVRLFTRSALIKLAFSRRSEVEGNEEQENFPVTFVSEESVSRCQ